MKNTKCFEPGKNFKIAREGGKQPTVSITKDHCQGNQGNRFNENAPFQQSRQPKSYSKNPTACFFMLCLSVCACSTVSFHEDKHSLSGRESCFSERESSFSERESSFSERENSFSERESSFSEDKHCFSERESSFVEDKCFLSKGEIW